jgi:hypothetical protein
MMFRFYSSNLLPALWKFASWRKVQLAMGYYPCPNYDQNLRQTRDRCGSWTTRFAKKLSRTHSRSVTNNHNPSVKLHAVSLYFFVILIAKSVDLSHVSYRYTKKSSIFSMTRSMAFLLMYLVYFVIN